jgi:N-acetyl-anhydromuramyl-L-alanine amidase AmpD
MQIQQTPSPNFTAGRQGRKIIAIVNHITGGVMPGTLNWLRNPDSKVSSHYLVTKNGEIYQLVQDENTAWHVGIVNKPNWPLYDGTNPNRYTIGIEHEARAGESLTESQYQATLWLHRQLAKKHLIPADTEHIIGHYRIDSINRANDPGPGFPWKRLLSDIPLEPTILPAVVVKIAGPTINGIIIDDVSYAPVRALAESLGYQVEWDADKNTVLIPPVTADIPPLQPGSVQIATGAVIIPGRLIDGKAYVPIRQLAETLGNKVEWDGKNYTVEIKKPGTL